MISIRHSAISRLWAAVLTLVLGVGAGVASAQVPASVADDEPGAELVVGVLTMGQGDLVYEVFGHNAIWIHDPVDGTDRVYNYGVFDFDSPGYWGRFIKGDWLYQLAVEDLSRTLWAYQYLNRSVWVQVLNLTPAEKRELRDFLEWNARPENREYLYDYYRDNCSTRVRDVIDQVLGGALRAVTEGVPTGTTFRWHSDRLIAGDRVSFTGLQVGLGPAADREIDQWQEMFIPFKVQEQLRRIEVTDAAGNRMPLVAHEELLYQAVGRAPERVEPPRWLLWYLLGGLAFGGLVALLGRYANDARAARVGLSVLVGGWALLLGFFGAVLLGLWTATNHEIAYRNENLLQINPLGLGLLVLVPALALGARWAVRPAKALALTLAALSLLGLVLKALPWFAQQNYTIIAFALPVHLAVAWVVLRTSRTATGAPAGPTAQPPAAGAARAPRRSNPTAPGRTY
jgi:hypothetical protein